MTRDQTAARTYADQPVMLRIGGVCAILGALVSVAAGTAVGNVTSTYGPQGVLSYIAARPEWYWPVGHLGFITGALLWVGTFVAFVRYASPGTSRVLGRLAAGSALVGASIHAIDSSISAYGLGALARAWASAAAGQQAELIETSRLLLWILKGTWAGVLTFFHGVPFVLIGLAVVFDPRQPTWFGTIAALAGLGSVAAGVARFVGAGFFPDFLFVWFAVLVSMWMVGLGIVMWPRARPPAVESQRRYFPPETGA